MGLFCKVWGNVVPAHSWGVLKMGGKGLGRAIHGVNLKMGVRQRLRQRRVSFWRLARLALFLGLHPATRSATSAFFYRRHFPTSRT